MAEDQQNARTKLVVALGRGGLKQSGGYVQEEFVRALQGQRGAKTYTEMAMNCPVVATSLLRIESACNRTKWRVDAADQNDPQARDVAAFVEACRNDLDRPWPEVLDDIYTMFQFGYAPLEAVYKRRPDGKVGWAKLALRGQESVTHWDIDDQDNVTAVHQTPPPDYQERIIPAERMLLFRTRARKNNPEGSSLLRPAYFPYLFWKGFVEKAAIGAERDLAGIPVGRVPAAGLTINGAEDQRAGAAAMKDIVENLRQHEQASALLPSDKDEQGNYVYDLQLLQGGGGKQFDILSLIKHFEYVIALAMLSDDALIGHEGGGSFALAQVTTDTIQKLLEGFLDRIAGVLNRQAVPRLMELNGIPEEKWPKFNHSGIAAKDTMRIVQMLKMMADAGEVVFPDERVARFLYQLEGLPIEGREEMEEKREEAEGDPKIVVPEEDEPEPPETPVPHKAPAPDDVAKGDLPGHEFRGNQYSDVGGVESQPGPSRDYERAGDDKRLANTIRSTDAQIADIESQMDLVRANIGAKEAKARVKAFESLLVEAHAKVEAFAAEAEVRRKRVAELKAKLAEMKRKQ